MSLLRGVVVVVWVVGGLEKGFEVDIQVVW